MGKLEKKVYYHPDGSIWKEYFANEKHFPCGSFKKWYINGQIDVVCNYVNGNLHGIYQDWYSSGTIDFMDQNKKNDAHGIRIEFEY